MSSPYRSRLFLALVTLTLSLAFGFLLTAPTSARADSSLLYVKPGGATSGNCDSWSTACDLQYALTTVAVSGTTTSIWVAAGTYSPTTGSDRTATFQLKNAIALYGGFAMTETARSERN